MKNFNLVCAAALALSSMSSVAQVSLTQLPLGPSLRALPLGGSIEGLLADPVGKLISIEGLSEIPANITSLVGNSGLFIPGLLAYGAALDPASTLSGALSIGSNTGLGALTGTLPVIGVLLSDPTSLLDLMNNDGLVSNFGIFGVLPAIPLINSGVGSGLPGLPGL